MMSRAAAGDSAVIPGEKSMTDTELGCTQWIGYAPHEDLRRGDRPLLPDKDPFYVPPLGYQHARPGTVHIVITGATSAP